MQLTGFKQPTERVVILTTDGRFIIGTLINSDNQSNIVRPRPTTFSCRPCALFFVVLNRHPLTEPPATRN